MNTLVPSEFLSLHLCKQEAREQLRCVKQELAAHDSNIALLQVFNTGSLKGKGYTRAAENYQPTREDKKRLPRTLANLNRQRVALLLEISYLKGMVGL